MGQVVNYSNEDPDSGITSVAFSSSGRVVFVGYDDHKVQAFDSIKVQKIGELVLVFRWCWWEAR